MFEVHRKTSYMREAIILSNIDKQKVEGQVTEALPNTTFRVVLNDGKEVLAYLSGKMRLHYIKIIISAKLSF